jgi:hypothetical protein
MRLLVLLFISFLSLHAEDALLLNAHIKMVPKIMALDTRLSSKGSSSKPLLVILYEGNRKIIAENIAKEITLHHNGKVANINFNVIALNINELSARRDVSFAYLTKMSEPSVKKVAMWGIANTIPTFSYDVSDLDNGILGSIAIERQTIIYINKNTFKEGKFRFNDTLFHIVRLIE